MARETVQGLHEVQETVQHPAIRQAAHHGGAHLRQFCDRCPGVPGPDVREGLREVVDLGCGESEGGTHIPHGMADLVGVAHADTGAAVGSEPIDDPAVDVGPTRRLHIDVDVRQHTPQWGQEPLHEQVVPDRVDPGDAEQIVHDTAGPGTPGGHPDPHRPDEVDDLRHSQEVPSEAECGDDPEFIVESLPGGGHLPWGEAGVQVRLTPCPQQHIRACGLDATLLVPVPTCGITGHDRTGGFSRWPARQQHIEFGDVDVAETEIRHRVEHALLREVGGDPQQATGLPTGDLLGDPPHVGRRRKETAGVLPVEMTGVQRDQPPDGIQQVGGGGLPGMDVTHGVGEDGRHPPLGRVRPHPARHGCRQIRTRALQAGVPRCRPVVDDLQIHLSAGDLPPAIEQTISEVEPMAADRSTDFRVRTQQDPQITWNHELLEQVPVHRGVAALTAGVGR